MINLTINDFEFSVKSKISILEACKYAGITIPRFCYHEILSVSGNCRMCLVEIDTIEKPVASCATEAKDGMAVFVDNAFVKKARENVVEALLLNHPLDCPICDQAGECDLQDQTKMYGSVNSRYFFLKTTVEDKYCGPLIKTIMTRCITCTRCVRYSSEVAGVDFFGTLNRGGSTEIGSYVSQMFKSEISGNVVDLCPVGALTSKPYAFKARPWELRMIESIDITDSLGSNIYVNYKENEIFRILPKNNKYLNNSIISDKARFVYESTLNNRIADLYFFSNEKKKLVKGNWLNFFNQIDSIVQNKKINIFFDEKTDLETANLLKTLAIKYQKYLKIFNVSKNSFNRGNFNFLDQRNTVENIDSTQDLFIYVGSNPRLESAILNSRIRYNYRNSTFKILVLGANYDYNIANKFVNLNVRKIIEVFEGKSKTISNNILKGKKPTLIFGQNVANRVSNFNFLVKKLQSVLPYNRTIALSLHANSSGVNLLNFKKTNAKVSNKSVNLFINNEDNTFVRKTFNKLASNIWINTHGSLLATKANVIIPTLSSFEEEAKYINIQGKPQSTGKSIMGFPNLRNVNTLLLSIFNISKESFKLNKIKFIKFLDEYLFESNKFEISKLEHSMISSVLKNTKYDNIVLINKYPIKQSIKNFYNTDSLSKNSTILNECAAEYRKHYSNF
jgi:NADH-quinone oxidoreductase chain G